MLSRRTAVWPGAAIAIAALTLISAAGQATSGLTPVQSLPAPQLPAWILQISPTGGQVANLSQIRVRFANYLIPLEAIESPDEQAKLRYFSVSPALPGKFRFLTPRMVGFETDRALPKATRVRVTLRAGLSDLSGHRLTQGVAWTFESDHIAITGLPSGDHIKLQPEISITSNVELDLISLRAATNLSPARGGAAIPLSINLAPQPKIIPLFGALVGPYQSFDENARSWTYNIRVRRALAKATSYRFRINAGVRPVHGNLNLDATQTSQFETYEPLRLLDAGCRDSTRFVNGVPYLRFNNMLADESVRTNTRLSPASTQADWVSWYEDINQSGVVQAKEDGLSAATTYDLTAQPGLTDIFGQTLGQAVSGSCDVGDFKPFFWAPDGTNILVPGSGFGIDITGLNLPEERYLAAYRGLKPEDLVYVDSASPQYRWMLPSFHHEELEVLPDPAGWASHRLRAPRNQTAVERMDITSLLGASSGVLAYGLRARVGKPEDPPADYYGLAHITNLAVFEQWFPDSGFVRVHHLSDGSVVAGAAVDVFLSNLGAQQRPAARPCARGVTGADGTATFDASALRGCMNGGTQFTKPPVVLAVAREGADWAYARTDASEWNPTASFYAGWEAGQPLSRGTIFSDRALYQPAETAWFTLEAYYLENGEVYQSRGTRYHISQTDPNGATTSLGDCATNDYGTCSFHETFKANQPVGDYLLSAKGPNGVQIAGGFRVAEFKAPNFKVALTLDHGIALAGQTVEARGQSDYLFGYPVDRGVSTFYVKRTQTSFAPAGWEQYTFGRQWFWPEQAPTVSADVLKEAHPTSRDGRASQTVRVANDLPYFMNYEVDLETADASNLSVADSKSFVALPSAQLVGLQSDWFGTEKKPFTVKLVVVDPHGKPLAGRAIHVVLQSMIYGEHQTLAYHTVQTADAVSSTSPRSLSLVAPSAGSYRIRANFAGARSDVTATDQQIWIAGEEPVWWGNGDDPLTVKLDKPAYAPGATANVLVQSPYKDAELYLAVVRRGVFYQTLTRVVGGAARFAFHVTEDMLPNAAVEAVLVRRDATLSDIRSGKLKSLSRTAFASFAVKLDAKYLHLRIIPEHDKVWPGGTQTVTLQLTDRDGRPVRGQLTVAVADESILQLTGYRFPDLVQTIYAPHDISTRLADNYSSVVLKPFERPTIVGPRITIRPEAAPAAGVTADVFAARELAKAAAPKAPGAAPRVRKIFLPLAYYNGAVTTDADGRATVTFKLPDDLTTWRVMAVAVGDNPTQNWHDFRFGNASATFVATQPLITNALLPQFARPGDIFEGGVNVTNNTGKPGTLDITGLLGGELAFVGGPRTTRLTQYVDQGSHAYRFSMVAGAAPLGQQTQASVQFTSRLGDASDAFQVPLVLRSLAFTEQAIDSGATRTQATVPLVVDPRVDNSAGGLEVDIASSLIPELIAPARNCYDDFFDAFPFLEPVSTRLLVSADLQILTKKYGQSFPGIDIPSAVAKDLGLLGKLQMPDGGFAWWPGGQRSDPWMSAYAGETLGQVEAAGFHPDTAMRNRLTSYLGRVLADPRAFIELCDTQCVDYTRLQMLLALNALGERGADYLDGIFDRRAELDLFSQFELARLLTQFPQYRYQAAQLADKLQQLVYETGRYAVVNLPESWRWYDSVTATQSQALRLYSARSLQMEVLDRLAQSLLARRRNGTWNNRYDDAQALTALIAYANLEPAPPSFSATVRLAGQQIAAAQFAGYAHPSRSVTIPMAHLPRNRHDVVLAKSGRGTLHYLVAYSYRLTGAQPGVLNGLRVTRLIRPAGSAGVLASMDLRAPTAPLTLGVGKVFEIEVQLIADHPVDHVMITDPLPAGLEAVDTSFATSTPSVQARADSWDIDYQSIYRDRIVAYANSLGPGIYELHYLARSVTPGLYLWPGSQAQLQFAPEEFGRSASSMLRITAH